MTSTYTMTTGLSYITARAVKDGRIDGVLVDIARHMARRNVTSERAARSTLDDLIFARRDDGSAMYTTSDVSRAADAAYRRAYPVAR